MQKSAVLIIDMQLNFLWGFRREERERLILSQIPVLEMARKYKIPVFVVEYKNFGKTVEELSVFLKIMDKVTYIKKKFDDAFKETSLQEELTHAHVKNIFLMGIHMDACVWSTAKSARKNDFSLFTNPLVIDGIPDFEYEDPKETLKASAQWFLEKTTIVQLNELERIFKHECQM